MILNMILYDFEHGLFDFEHGFIRFGLWNMIFLMLYNFEDRKCFILNMESIERNRDIPIINSGNILKVEVFFMGTSSNRVGTSPANHADPRG